MKKKGLILAIMAALGMTACGSAIPDMTDEQNAMIVEYAAGLLLKYDKNHHNRLVDESELAEEEVQIQEAETPEQEPQPEEESAEETTVEDVSEEPETVIYQSIEEFYGIEGMAFQFMGYELKDSYPDNGTDEMFFAMNASNGCKLAVLHFNADNTSGQDKTLDMMSVDSKFKISFNGESPKYALTTMLMDDLASYQGTIAAGETQQLVLIAELQDEKAQSIQTIELIMKSNAEEATLSLN